MRGEEIGRSAHAQCKSRSPVATSVNEVCKPSNRSKAA